MRKIVQITADGGGRDSPALFALCEDDVGARSVWWIVPDVSGDKWERLPPIPQDEPPATKKYNPDV